MEGLQRSAFRLDAVGGSGVVIVGVGRRQVGLGHHGEIMIKLDEVNFRVYLLRLGRIRQFSRGEEGMGGSGD